MINKNNNLTTGTISRDQTGESKKSSQTTSSLTLKKSDLNFWESNGSYSQRLNGSCGQAAKGEIDINAPGPSECCAIFSTESVAAISFLANSRWMIRRFSRNQVYSSFDTLSLIQACPLINMCSRSVSTPSIRAAILSSPLPAKSRILKALNSCSRSSFLN